MDPQKITNCKVTTKICQSCTKALWSKKTYYNKGFNRLVCQQGDKPSKSKKPPRKTVLCEVIWFLDIDAIFWEGRSQVLHSQSVLLILYMKKTKVSQYFNNTPLFTHTALSKYCIEVLFNTDLCLAPWASWGSALHFTILQCIIGNVWDKLLRSKGNQTNSVEWKWKLLLWFCLSVHSQTVSFNHREKAKERQTDNKS